LRRIGVPAILASVAVFDPAEKAAGDRLERRADETANRFRTMLVRVRPTEEEAP